MSYPRNLVLSVCPGQGLSPGPRSLMAANVTTRIRRPPIHSFILSVSSFVQGFTQRLFMTYSL